MEVFRCDDCNRLFSADEVEIYEEWYGRMCRKYRGCPYCGSDTFYETKLPYGNDCKDYAYCDFNCENCNVVRGQNPICKHYEDCTFDCESCPIYLSGKVN